jgi:ABC-2 type transport system ATP-binding protein
VSEDPIEPAVPDPPRTPRLPSTARPLDEAASGSSDAVVEVRGVTKRFGRAVAVDDLSFTVRRGLVTAFLGPNGAGKTTTLRVILGLARPDQGIAKILGRPYRLLDDPARRVGALLEVTGFHPGRTARNHLRMLAIEGGVGRDRVDELLEWVGLGEAADRRVGSFSSGMRQRLGLAAALLAEPEVLILDEPGSGLDPEGTRWLREFLRSLAAGGTTVLVSSHVLAEVAQTADEVVIIDRGRRIAQGPIDRLTSAAGTSVVVRSPDADRLAGHLRDAGGDVTRSTGTELGVRGLRVEDVGRAAADNGVVLHELRSVEPSLEDVFLALTRAEDSGPGGAAGDEATRASGGER